MVFLGEGLRVEGLGDESGRFGIDGLWGSLPNIKPM